MEATDTQFETATRKKLSLSSSSVSSSAASQVLLSSDNCAAWKENVGYRLLKMQKLEFGLGELCVCVHCHSPVKLVQTFSHRSGLVSKISIECCNTACKLFVLQSDPSSWEVTVLNDAAILGTRMSGCGHSAIELSACSGMLPPLSRLCGQSTTRLFQQLVLL